MFSDIELQYVEPYEIAEALIKGDETLAHLRSIPTFSSKSELVEDAVWNSCKSQSNIKRYLELYPTGNHLDEADDAFWNECYAVHDIERYLKMFPNGRHLNEADEMVWNSAIAQKDIDAVMMYAERFPSGIHIQEVDDMIWIIAKEKGCVERYLKLFPQGKHVSEANEIIGFYNADDAKWKEASNFNTIRSYDDYLQSYPNGRHRAEAEDRKREIGIEQRKQVVDGIKNDRNSQPLTFIKSIGITKDDLRGVITDSKGNVRNEVLESYDESPADLSMGTTPDSIPEGATEVYFWGVPGSGKTCAMAAILSQTRNLGFFAPRTGPGLAYMNGLSQIFLTQGGKKTKILPKATPVEETQYLPLALNEKVVGKRGKETIKQHKVSIVEISGEIFECFSNELEAKPFKTERHERTYNQLKKYLKDTSNPKYHFFMIDSKPLKDADQMTYLQNAALYFKINEIFNATTQGISLIVTKCDTLSPDRNKWTACATSHARDHYGALVNQLKLIVGDPRNGGLGISDGHIDVIPLSIGEVFLQNLCVFDPQPSTDIVNMLMRYSKVAETDDWRKKSRRLFRR